MAITVVPSTVRCIQVVATGSTTVTDSLNVTPVTSSATLTLGRLPLGSVEFTASAFDVACASIGGTQPSWVADPVAAFLTAGIPTTISLTFRLNNVVTASANFVQSAVAVAPPRGNDLVTFMVMADGTMRATGAAEPGVMSNSFANQTLTLPLTDVGQFAAGQNHFCFIKRADGSVWCGGTDNTFGQLGNGFAAGTSSTVPARVTFPMGFGAANQIIAGQNFSCASVIPTGPGFSPGLAEMFCWGDNTEGELGNTTTVPFPNPTPTPVVFAGSTTPALIAGQPMTAGYTHACVNFGELIECWGSNDLGELGDGTINPRFGVTGVLNAEAVVSVALGNEFSCAVSADGTARCWGSNNSGQLGDGTLTDELFPSVNPSVVGITDATQVAAGEFHACVLRKAGTVACWGQNANGQLGDGTGQTQPAPVAVLGLSGVSSLTAGDFTSFALMADRTIQAWGLNLNGTLGDGTRILRFVPAPVVVQ